MLMLQITQLDVVHGQNLKGRSCIHGILSASGNFLNLGQGGFNIWTERLQLSQIPSVASLRKS